MPTSDLLPWLASNASLSNSLLLCGHLPDGFQVDQRLSLASGSKLADAGVEFSILGESVSENDVQLLSRAGMDTLLMQQVLQARPAGGVVCLNLRALPSQGSEVPGHLKLSTLGFPACTRTVFAWPSSHLVNTFVESIVVISLPSRHDRRRQLLWDFSGQGVAFTFAEAQRPDVNTILWREMRHMEAYSRTSNLRGDYVIGAVGCKRSTIEQLSRFVKQGAESCLLIQDDCELAPHSGSVLGAAWPQLPKDWDMVYFGASHRSPPIAISANITKVTAARHCTAIIFRHSFAKRILPDLSESGMELDYFLEHCHSRCNAYCIEPMIVRQRPGFSDITQKFSKNANSTDELSRRVPHLIVRK